MGKGTTRGLRLALASVGVGVAFAVPAIGIAGVAQADSSYTSTGSTPPQSTPTSPVTSPATSSTSTLAFTGADIAEMSAVGAAAIGGGVVLIWRGKRRRALA